MCMTGTTKIHFSATEALLIFLCADKLDSVLGVTQMLVKPNEFKTSWHRTEPHASWMHMRVTHARHTLPRWSLKSCLLFSMCVLAYVPHINTQL